MSCNKDENKSNITSRETKNKLSSVELILYEYIYIYTRLSNIEMHKIYNAQHIENKKCVNCKFHYLRSKMQIFVNVRVNVNNIQ